MIKGITVTLLCQKQTGTDAFNHPVYEDDPVEVENVLVCPASTQEVLDAQNLFGKKAVYNIAIPKGDTHTWQDQKVQFFGETWRVIGFQQKGIEENIPLDWNEKWMVERYGT
jgi:hypothetical protein